MPSFHGSLTNSDFVKASNIASAKGMELKDWVTGIVIAEIHKVSNVEYKGGN
jgi:hypothetical protein